MCLHQPPRPPADAQDHDSARLSATDPEQGWSPRHNGVVSFADPGELLPDRCAVPAPRTSPDRSA
ncbi:MULTISPECIES: DUF5999 family protein [Streptomyces]|uniref:DUF5999 family protein n=1 Tax=Streptomyces TaxID=1883 RepID=UPI00099E583C|nr:MULTISPECIES: DUF5999 family protein [Streptomyces]MCO8304308.1 DUF5999 family protein [Streptomyces sp. RKCA744]MDN3060219.1 DUF5999 family protein [Streptomyces sp. SRF1]